MLASYSECLAGCFLNGSITGAIFHPRLYVVLHAFAFILFSEFFAYIKMSMK